MNFKLLKLRSCASPFRTNLKKVGGVALLGGHSGWVLDHLHDLWINLDVQIVSARQPLIPILYLGSYPISEGLPNYRAADINKPLQQIEIELDDKNFDVKT